MDNIDIWLDTRLDGRQYGLWMQSGEHKVFALLSGYAKDRPAEVYVRNALRTLENMVDGMQLSSY